MQCLAVKITNVLFSLDFPRYNMYSLIVVSVSGKYEMKLNLNVLVMNVDNGPEKKMKIK